MKSGHCAIKANDVAFLSARCLFAHNSRYYRRIFITKVYFKTTDNFLCNFNSFFAYSFQMRWKKNNQIVFKIKRRSKSIIFYSLYLPITIKGQVQWLPTLHQIIIWTNLNKLFVAIMSFSYSYFSTVIWKYSARLAVTRWRCRRMKAFFFQILLPHCITIAVCHLFIKKKIYYLGPLCFVSRIFINM